MKFLRLFHFVLIGLPSGAAVALREIKRPTGSVCHPAEERGCLCLWQGLQQQLEAWCAAAAPPRRRRGAEPDGAALGPARGSGEAPRVLVRPNGGGAGATVAPVEVVQPGAGEFT
eukprot:g17290.t1